MKKVSKKRADWLVRNQSIRNRRQLFLSKVARRHTRQLQDTLIAPAYFCLTAANGERNQRSIEFLKFIREIRRFKGKALCIDLTSVQRMVVNATLLFKSELSYLVQRGLPIKAIPPRKQRTNQVMAQTGLATLLGLPVCEKIDREDTVHWRHVSGIWNFAQPSRLGGLLNGQHQQNAALYTGLIESVANCIEHAYKQHPDRRTFIGSQDGWWGFQQLRDGELSTCICDLGIGISKSLPLKLSDEPDMYAKLMNLFRRFHSKDIRSILAAIEYGKSSTGSEERGKGLRDAHSVIDNAGSGQLQIFSNKGMYIYNKDANKPAVSGTRKLAESIEGTIYYWRHPIQSQPNTGEMPVEGALS